MAPEATLRTTTLSVQAPDAGSAPVFASVHDTVMGCPEVRAPPGALTAKPCTRRSGADVVSGADSVTGAEGVSSNTLNA